RSVIISLYSCSSLCSVILRHLHSFPTRRSSDLEANRHYGNRIRRHRGGGGSGGNYHRRDDYQRGKSSAAGAHCHRRADHRHAVQDRKSTRLNSSHGSISYAVFCLKKKTKSSASM